MKPLEAWHIIGANMQQLYKRRRAEHPNWKGYTDDELTAEVMCFEALRLVEKGEATRQGKWEKDH